MCKSKKAIATLNKHLEGLSSISNVQQGNTWKASLKDTLNIFIGENSSISQRLDKLHFTRVESGTIPGGIITGHVYDDSKKQNFRDLISSGIQHIQSNGVYKNPNKKNFLSGFNNTEIISGIVFSIGVVSGAGYYFGKLERDKETLQSEEKNKEIKKENDYLKLANDSLNNNAKTLTIIINNLRNDTIKKIK